jgi:hemerythrin-like domain-containing protein
MQVRDLDGNLSLWHLTGNIVKGNLDNKSSYHLKARSLIRQVYPTMQILEEVTIYPHKSESLYLDFYIPLIKKCIEVHGEQHYKFVSHYHTNKLAFLKAQKRDKAKKEWCELNGIKYIELSYDQQDKWESLITNE